MRQDGDVRTGRHRVFALHAHLVFVTKYRHPVFTDTHLERMGRSWGGLPRLRRELVECNGETGHVHLLVRFPRPWRCRGWSTASRASPPGGCVRSSPNWPDTTGGRSGCGPGRTLPGRWAAPRWTFSAPTSSSRTGLATRFTPRLKAGALPRGAGSRPGTASPKPPGSDAPGRGAPSATLVHPSIQPPVVHPQQPQLHRPHRTPRPPRGPHPAADVCPPPDDAPPERRGGGRARLHRRPVRGLGRGGTTPLGGGGAAGGQGRGQGGRPRRLQPRPRGHPGGRAVAQAAAGDGPTPGR